MNKKGQSSDKQKDKKDHKKEIPVKEEAKKQEEVKDQEEDSTKDSEAEVKKEPSVEEKLAELQDKYLRLSADFDNYRKRTLKERIDLVKSANEELFTKILPVMDDFDRAVQQIDEAKDLEALKEGIHLIYGKFGSFLSQEGIKEIEALHKEFDTDTQEAVTKIPAPEKKLKGKVVDVIQKGYYLNDKVIRFSKVVIGE